MKNRTSILLDPGDLSASPGSEKWALAVRLQIQAKIKDLHDVENHLKTWRDGFRKFEGWRVLRDRRGREFQSWESFCSHPKPEGLGINSDELDAEVERRNLLPHGGDRKSSEVRNQGSVPTLIGRGSRYLKARLERDRPELLAMVNDGELSIEAAAVEAGWRKRMVKCQPTVDGFVRAIIKHLSEGERGELKERI